MADLEHTRRMGDLENTRVYGNRPAAEGTYGIYGGRSFASPPSEEFAKPARPSLAPPHSTDHSILRGGTVVGGYSMIGIGYQMTLWELVVTPWLFQAIVLGCCLIGGLQGNLSVLLIPPATLLLLSGIALRHHQKQRHSGEVLIAFLCIVALLIGSAVGWFANISWLAEYHRLSQGASYFNVLPYEASAGKLDARTIVFTPDSAVITSKAFGLVDADAAIARTYCVAPVMTTSDVQTRVEYWVAGTNCCRPRSDFQCGDVANMNAHAAIVLPKDSQDDPSYAEAIKGASDAYGLQSSNNFLLLSWSQDPVGFRDRLWKDSWMLLTLFSAAYLLVSIMASIVLMQSFQKREL